MKSVFDYVGAIHKATVGHRYQYARVVSTYRPYVIGEWFPYTTGVKVSYLDQLWTKSVIDYVGVIRKATVEYWFRYSTVALHIASPILVEKGGNRF